MNLEGSLEVSKKLLWVFVGQIAVKLQALKVGYLKKVLPLSPLHGWLVIESQTMGSLSKFDRLQICSSLIQKDPKYLFEKI